MEAKLDVSKFYINEKREQTEEYNELDKKF